MTTEDEPTPRVGDDLAKVSNGEAAHGAGTPGEEPGARAETPAEGNPSGATAEGDGPKAPAEKDAPESPAATDGTSLFGTARSAAMAGSRSIGEGISAVRDLSRAKRAHAEAARELAGLERTIAEQREELEHRVEVERDFERIVETQEGEISEAQAALRDATKRQASTSTACDAKNDELKKLKEANERRIAPYRELADTSHGSFVDAERALADARRALKVAQSQADSATNNRDSRLSSARRAADSAANRLQRLQDQLAQMRRDPTNGAKEISEMSGAVAGALAQLENARADVARIGRETDQAVEISQTHLYTQKRSLEEAQADFDEARSHEREHRAHLDKLRGEADKAESKLTGELKELEDKLAAIEGEREAAQERLEAARGKLEEARDIHAHPEVTERLEATIAEDEAEAKRSRAHVDELAHAVEKVRTGTQRARRTLMVAVTCVACVLVLVLWLALGRG